jgi:hypothetical protein
MEKAPKAPRSLALSTRLYQTLLAVYPAEFRLVYGSLMLQAFRDCARRALRERGQVGLLALWMRTILDTVQTAIEEHAQRGIDMSKEKFIKLSGWAMMLGPILFLVGAWANERPNYSPYNAASLPIDRYANIAGVPLQILGLVFLTLGILGMMLRYASRWDSMAIFLGLGVLAGVVSTVGAAGLAVNDNSPWWELFFLGLVAQFTALAMFGLINLRRRLLPRWNWLPVLAIWLPIVTLFSLGIFQWEVGVEFFTGLWILTCAMFAGLGYLLQSDPRPATMSAAA